jgi:hypothetical protein
MTSVVRDRVRLVSLLAGVFVLAGAVGVQQTGAASPPPLTLNVNAGGALEVVLGNGTRLRTSNAPGAVIPPGAYLAIVASDVPDSVDIYHMYHLFGPGVNLSSELLPCENPAPVNTVVLQPSSTYTYEDSRHPDITHVVFTTSASGSSADTAGSAGGPATAKATGSVSNSSVVGSDAASVRATLVAALGGSGAPSLSLKGRRVSSLAPGRYRITIVDRTSRLGFAIGKAHASPKSLTGPSFVGTRTVTLVLTAGTWRVSSSGGAGRSFTVT